MTTVYKPLYDLENGGPPEGFKCLLARAGAGVRLSSAAPASPRCGEVTRTEKGMHMHQGRVHKFKAQRELFEVE